MGRAAYIRRRLILMAFVLFGVTVVIFGMVRIIPGDPAFLILGDRATDQKAAELREQLGLNRPFLEQYWMFVSGFAHGDMGKSLLYRQPVGDLVLARVPITLALAGYAMGLAAVITLTFGIVAAVNKGRWPDQLIRIGFLFALTTPNFWFGILLILLFGLTLHWFPVAGFGETLPQHVWYLFLPALTLALQLSAVLIRNLRGQIIRTMRADYVRTAHAQGLSGSLVLLRHVVRNALLSTLTIFGLRFGFLVGGAIVVETVFALPGTGQLLIQSITARDYPVVQAITVISAVLVIVVNLVVDLSYSFLDPRVTYECEGSRRPGRHGARLPWRAARPDPHADCRRADGVPVPHPGDRDHEHPRAGADQPLHRGRRGRLDPICAHHTRRNTRDASLGVRAGRPDDRLLVGAHHAAPHPAERDRAGADLCVHGHGAGDPHRGDAELPRPWPAAAHPGMGRDDRRRPSVPAARMVDDDAARAGAPGRRCRAQPDRRRTGGAARRLKAASLSSPANVTLSRQTPISII